MHLVYIDEVKHDPPRRPHFWLCALACPEASILELERRVTTIVSDYFGASTLARATELHARELLWGKGIYKGHPQHERLALYQRLVDVIDETNDLCRIQIRIDPRRVVAATYRDKAFMFLVEKVDS